MKNNFLMELIIILYSIIVLTSFIPDVLNLPAIFLMPLSVVIPGYLIVELLFRKTNLGDKIVMYLLFSIGLFITFRLFTSFLYPHYIFAFPCLHSAFFFVSTNKKKVTFYQIFAVIFLLLN